ncbi:gfo/Idh/MocA family oxidoreductase [Alphaproteobacteria bacterium]|nr:gfo/Idh/MocA family oxidoreductase [Alphaproteobacteria bacterium]
MTSFLSLELKMMSLWLIGAGIMAQDYARVLQGLDLPFEVIGRGADSADKFRKATGKLVRTGGLANAIRTGEAPEKAIIAVGVEQLAPTAAELIRAGVKRIMVEKPAGLDLAEIETLNRTAEENRASVLLAYNRRFYGSVQQARECILEDGGVLSAQFEFTEWSHVIREIAYARGVKERMVLGNSSHVIDLVFNLIGRPVDWKCWHAGSIDWHPAAARFAGAGITEQSVMFSYLADWQAPGRWGVELLTAKRRLILRPMEQLQVTPLGTVKIEAMDPLDSLDQDYKPGLYRQTQAFIAGNDNLFCTLPDHVENVRIYSEMAGYL